MSKKVAVKFGVLLLLSGCGLNAASNDRKGLKSIKSENTDHYSHMTNEQLFLLNKALAEKDEMQKNGREAIEDERVDCTSLYIVRDDTTNQKRIKI